jgi:hypothetical protein
MYFELGLPLKRSDDSPTSLSCGMYFELGLPLKRR